MTMLDPDSIADLRRLKKIYVEEVAGARNRSISLWGRKCQPQIIYTLLGYEVKAGKKRITCPDTVTARYLSLFSEIGLDSVRLPYDPTVTARILPQLESIMESIKERIRTQEPDRSRAQRILRAAYSAARRRVKQAEKRAIPAVNAPGC